MSKYPHFNPEKYGLDVKVACVQKGFHCTYNINYHFIWIPKYRKQLLVGNVRDVLENVIKMVCKEYGWDLLALEVMPDHVHLFLGARPKWSPSQIINIVKGNTSRTLRRAFPELQRLGYRYKKYPALWARGYYCGTAGHVSQEQVIRYIMEQKEKN